MLTDTETTVRDAIREVYEGHMTGEEIQLQGETKYLILQLGKKKFGVNLSKLTRMYETGRSLAAIKTVSRFDLNDPALEPREKQQAQPSSGTEKRCWLRRIFRRG